MRSPKNRSLQVCLNGRSVGLYSKLKGGGITFQYMESWLDWEKAIPISQSMPLQAKPYRGDVVSTYFENLLPDSDLVLRKIADKVGADGRDAYSLLTKIGRDCVGGLQFLAWDEAVQLLSKPKGRRLSDDDISRILENLERAPLGIETEGGFRISLAGAQEKAAFLKMGPHWYEPEGLSPTTHIFKPAIGKVYWDSGEVDMTKSVQNEYYCLRLMQAFGFKTANVEIDTFGGKEVLIVERFDRLMRDNVIIRLPQEDMCQALGFPPSQKYQNQGGPNLVDILKFLAASETPHEDQMTVFKCQILFWLIGAIDGHAKNFSIFLAPNDGFRLTPIYDVLSGRPAFDKGQIRHKDYRLAMSVGKNNKYRIDNIHGRHFLETAIAADLPEEFAREAICLIQDWFEIGFDATMSSMPIGFPRAIHESIFKAAKTRLLRLQSAFL